MDRRNFDRWINTVEAILKLEYNISNYYIQLPLDYLKTIQKNGISPREFVQDYVGHSYDSGLFENSSDDDDFSQSHSKYYSNSNSLIKTNPIKPTPEKEYNPETLMTLEEGREVFYHDGHYDWDSAWNMAEYYSHLLQAGWRRGQSAYSVIHSYHLI